MVNDPLAKVKEMEYIYLTMIKAGDKGISMGNFLCFTSKNKELLKLLTAYDMITKDDIRPSFGSSVEDLPDCDSDLENEVYRKGKVTPSVNFDLLEHPLINVRFLVINRNSH